MQEQDPNPLVRQYQVTLVLLLILGIVITAVTFFIGKPKLAAVPLIVFGIAMIIIDRRTNKIKAQDEYTRE